MNVNLKFHGFIAMVRILETECHRHSISHKLHRGLKVVIHWSVQSKTSRRKDIQGPKKSTADKFLNLFLEPLFWRNQSDFEDILHLKKTFIHLHRLLEEVHDDLPLGLPWQVLLFHTDSSVFGLVLLGDLLDGLLEEEDVLCSLALLVDSLKVRDQDILPRLPVQILYLLAPRNVDWIRFDLWSLAPTIDCGQGTARCDLVLILYQNETGQPHQVETNLQLPI